MNINQLLHFQTIYKYQNMTRAANHLYITQQGLSRSIKSLEDELETPLFIRTASGVLPTPYAEAIISQTSQILKLYDDISKKLTYMKSQDQNSLVIDYNAMILDSFPHGTKHMLEDILFPNVNFTFNIADESAALEHLLDNEADLALISAPVDVDHFRIFPLKSYPVMAIIHPSNPLSREKVLSIENMREQKLITFSRRFNIYHHFLQACKEKHISPDFTFEVADTLHMYFLCKENEGIGICPSFYCDHLPKTDVNFVPFSSDFIWTVTITANCEKEITPIIQSYVKTFQSMIRK